MDICKELISQFNIKDEYISSKPYGSGHINDTFLVTCKNNKYLLQRINHDIFKNPYEVMENIHSICKHIKNKVIEENGDVEKEVMNFIKTKNGTYVCEADGNYYRMYIYVDDVACFQTVENPKLFYYAGKSFGKFQQRLSDFPAYTLHETIKNFHNTKDRFEIFEKAIENDFSKRASSVMEEINFVKERKNDTEIIVNLLEKNEIPLRVTHNDTKLNNILMDKDTLEGVCVIDLDTVMPSTLLYDFGDAIRFGATTAEEDEKDLSKVNFDINLFEEFAKGFIETMKNDITEKEVELLAFSAKLLTLECGMRFLTDHIDGDKYFKIHRENHNLDRARNQFKLVSDMEQQMDKMNEIVMKIYNS